MQTKQQYVETAQELVTELKKIAAGKKHTIETTLDPKMLAQGRIRPSKDSKMSTITRQEFNDGMALAIKNAKENGPKVCRDLPSNPKAALSVNYTPSQGNHAGQTFCAVIWGLKSTEYLLGRQARGARGANYFATIEAAVKNGTAFFVQIVVDGKIVDVVDEEGTPRPSATEAQAVNVGARQIFANENNLTFKAARNWYNDDINGKGTKAELKSKVVGTYQSGNAPQDRPLVENMTSQQIIKMAKTNGAPTEIARSAPTATLWLFRKNLVV